MYHIMERKVILSRIGEIFILPSIDSLVFSLPCIKWFSFLPISLVIDLGKCYSFCEYSFDCNGDDSKGRAFRVNV